MGHGTELYPRNNAEHLRNGLHDAAHHASHVLRGYQPPATCPRRTDAMADKGYENRVPLRIISGIKR